MIIKYRIELEGQKDFYSSYLKLVNRNLNIDDIINDNNDGVLRGNLLEFKLYINDLNTVLFQAIKYLSSRRVKGKPVPANIILVSLNEGRAYLYKSDDYLPYIEAIYIGGASKDNTAFQCGSPTQIFDYVKKQLDEASLIKFLKSDNYTKIHIDENNIVGWATHFYCENPTARKSDFIGDLTGKVKIIGEIRKPDKFQKYIYPYNEASNVKFNYLMDKLNDEIQKKNLGAFYTPPLYVKKSVELVRKAISRVPKGNNYIILDRCAGTGNLELSLTNEELSHVIVSTYEYYEYKVLLELLGDKVLYIIPPTEKNDTFQMGLVRGADALSEEYINNPVIKEFIDNPKVTIILFENPPYAETTSIEWQKKQASKQSTIWKHSYVVQEMKKEVSGIASNELGNAFIWSAFKYYLRQPTDSYIIFSPVKYWKAQHLINKKFDSGFAFNRKHFHTNTDACIMVALWTNENDYDLVNLQLQAFDIVNNELCDEGFLDVKKIYTVYSDIYYDKRSFSDTTNGILTGLNGLEIDDSVKKSIRPLYNENILGYMVADSSGFDNPDTHSSLLVAGRYNGHGFYLRKDNYLEKLLMFAASRYITYNRNWKERARIMKSGDGCDKFFADIKAGKLKEYLIKVLLFCCLETQNHMRTFLGSNGIFYRNEICLDNTQGDTIATAALKNMILNNKEQKLLLQWDTILKNAKNTDNYNKNITYGVYQIQKELNTFIVEKITRKKVYNYPELNGNITTLKSMLKSYYLSEIVPPLFEYQFLK